MRNQTVQHGSFCLIHRAYSIQCVLHELSMTNVKTAKEEIAMSVILAQGPCMDMSSVLKLSDSAIFWTRVRL
jgi:hypothetical protein